MNAASKTLLAAVVSLAFCVSPSWAVLVAEDDASNYSSFGNGSVGGFGFEAWEQIGNIGGSGSGGAFLGSGNGDIGTGGSSRVWGVFGNGGGVGQAVRPFSQPVSVGGAFSISLDTVGVNGGGTVGLALQNSSGDNLFEFFFVGGGDHYIVNRNGGTFETSVDFTTSGIQLELTLTDADSFSLEIDQLGTPGVDQVVAGDLISQSSQEISQLRLFNANGGPDVFFNSLSISAIPELSPALAWPLLLAACVLPGLLRRCRRPILQPRF